MLRFFGFHCLARLNAALKSNTVDCLLCTGQKTRNPPRQVAPCCSMECMYNNSIRSRTHRGYCFNRLLVYYWWNVVDIVVLGTNNSLWLKSFVPQSSMYSNMKGIFPALFFFQMCISYTYIGHVRVYQGYQCDLSSLPLPMLRRFAAGGWPLLTISVWAAQCEKIHLLLGGFSRVLRE